MPLLGPTSYSPTLQLFLIHWAEVNSRLGVGHELVLPDGLTLAGAQALHSELEVRVTVAGGAAIDLLIARGTLQIGRTALRARLGQFGDLVRAYWKGTPWAALMPNLPQVAAASDKFLLTCREALRLWALLETEPAPPGVPMPITLDPGGAYGLADFTAEVAAVSAAALAVEEALWARSVALARRDAKMAVVKMALMAYNRAVPGRLPAGDVLVEKMPALWPPPGHTPDAVPLTGAWDAVEKAARFSWEASADKMLHHYELRACAGQDYDTALEEVVARADKEAPRELVTRALVGTPDAQAAFRLYVVLTTGNERGSETVVVTQA